MSNKFDMFILIAFPSVVIQDENFVYISHYYSLFCVYIHLLTMYHHGMTPKFYTFGKLISDLLDLVERGRNTQQGDLIGLDMMNSEKKESICT